MAEVTVGFENWLVRLIDFTIILFSLIEIGGGPLVTEVLCLLIYSLMVGYCGCGYWIYWFGRILMDMGGGGAQWAEVKDYERFIDFSLYCERESI